MALPVHGFSNPDLEHQAAACIQDMSGVYSHLLKVLPFSSLTLLKVAFVQLYICSCMHRDLCHRLQETVKYELTNTSEQLLLAQAERDQKALRLEQLARQHGVEEGEDQSGLAGQEPELAVIKGHLNRIAALEKEVKHLKQVWCLVCAMSGMMTVVCLAWHSVFVFMSNFLPRTAASSTSI